MGRIQVGDSHRESARALVLRHGWNAAAYQILNTGMHLWFAMAVAGAFGGGSPFRLLCRALVMAARRELRGTAGARK